MSDAETFPLLGNMDLTWNLISVDSHVLPIFYLYSRFSPFCLNDIHVDNNYHLAKSWHILKVLASMRDFETYATVNNHS